MKKIVSFLIFTSICLFCFSQAEAEIGISEAEFIQNFPDYKFEKYENTTVYLKPETIYGIEDCWLYRFENGPLSHVLFLHYDNKIDSENFNLNLSAAKHLIQDFTELYGAPDSLMIGDTIFVDPYIQQHWGYDVIEARWNGINGMKIKVGFNFFGGKAEYSFIFTVSYHSEDYPYFD
jgi:hypothetical protein